ncbi:MAG: hypothetical protein KFB93_05290 [Simkaniaceae bacterium]|nr:MAG: hypothetical protein KFB93_05290 [Simkaniaceae bacterium]
MALTGALGLRQHIWLEIVVPKTTEESIKGKASSLGFKNNLDREQSALVYGTIHSDILDEIKGFMQTDQARAIYKDVSLIDPRAWLSDDIGKRLETQIFDIYSVNLFPNSVTPSQPQSLSSWFWSMLKS